MSLRGSKNQLKSTLGAPRAEKEPKSRAPVVDFGEGRDPGEGVGGGEIPPPGRGRGIETREPLNHLSPEAGGIHFIHRSP